MWVVLCVTLTGCTLGPNYVRPKTSVPAAFKEMEGWKAAQPRDNQIPVDWWKIYADAPLADLMRQVNVSNLTLAQAEAQYRQSQGLLQIARAGYVPTVTGTANASRNSSNRNPALSSTKTSNSYSLALDANWELDIWGRVRRQVEAGQANVQASAGDLGAARLSVQAQLATAYFQLRATDAQYKLLSDTIAAYDKSLQLVKNQYAAGVASKADVAQAETQLNTTRAQSIDIGVQRAQLEHAIAVLIGKPPAEFSLPKLPLNIQPPPMPVSLPSALLERRPDVAAAERRVAAANAQIGVVQAAYFPTLSLSGAIGFASTSFARLVSAPARFWSLGPSMSETIFNGELRQGQNAQAVAIYDAAAAAYKQSVLTSIQEVEDSLAALRILDEEAKVQDVAVTNANQSLTLTINQYKAGTVSYLNVILVQTTALSNERTAVDILSRRMAASVALVKALGGGWVQNL